MINKILVATDFSENANRALDFAVDLAEKLNAFITVLNVIQYITPVVAIQGGFVLPDNYFSDIKKMHEHEMDNVVNKLKGRKPNLRISFLVKEGYPVNEIISMAKDFDIIVIGHKGLSRMHEAFMGTTSERIVHLAKCPVLVVQ